MTKVPGVTLPKRIVQLPQPKMLPSPFLLDESEEFYGPCSSPCSTRASPASRSPSSRPSRMNLHVASDGTYLGSPCANEQELERMRAMVRKGNAHGRERLLARREQHDYFRMSIGATPMNTTKKEEARAVERAAQKERKERQAAARAAEVAALIDAERVESAPLWNRSGFPTDAYGASSGQSQSASPTQPLLLKTLSSGGKYVRAPSVCSTTSAVLWSALVPTGCSLIAAMSYGVLAVIVAAIVPAVVVYATLFTPTPSVRSYQAALSTTLPITADHVPPACTSWLATQLIALCAASVQLLMGAAVVVQAYVVLTSGDVTIADAAIVVACSAILLPDACGWLFSSKACRSKAAIDLTARLNEVRMQVDAGMDHAGEALQDSARTFREQLLRRWQGADDLTFFVADPEQEGESQLLLRLSTWAEVALDEIGFRARFSPLKTTAAILSVILAVDWISRTPTGGVENASGDGVDGAADAAAPPPVLLVALATATLTFVATGDWVRRLVRPKEYDEGCKSDALRRLARGRRLVAERELTEALRAPMSWMGMERTGQYLEDLQDACVQADEEHVRAALLEPAIEHLVRTRNAYDEALARRRCAELALKSLTQEDAFLLDISRLQAAVDEGREAHVDEERVEKAAALLVEANRVQRARVLATDRLLRVCPLTNEGEGYCSRLDTTEISAALKHAIECRVKEALILQCEERLKEARDMQEGIARDVVAFFSILRNRATKRKIREGILQRLSAANGGCQLALEKLRRSRNADLLLDAADELAAAIDEAQKNTPSINAAEEQHSTLATIRAVAQRLNTTKERLTRSTAVATHVLLVLRSTSHQGLSTIIEELKSALSVSDEALVPLADIERSRVALKATQTAHEKRVGAYAALKAAQLRLDRQQDASSILRVAPEHKLVIARADHLELDDETMTAAHLHLEKACARAIITTEIEVAERALKWFERSQSSDSIGKASEALTEAVKRGKAVLIDEFGKLEPCVTEAQELLDKCKQLHAAHDASHKRMAQASRAVEEMMKAFGAEDFDKTELGRRVDELSDAVEEAREARVQKALIQQAQHILTPARALARFGF